jgi:hypothetical protein
MPELELLLLFTRGLRALGARYMVSGSVAAGMYGAPRLTNDIDIVVVLDRAQIARLPDVFSDTDFYCPPIEAIQEEAAREEPKAFEYNDRSGPTSSQPRTPRFLSTKQAPPARRTRLQRASAARRVSAPILTW